jgi:hypothetical protein
VEPIVVDEIMCDKSLATGQSWGCGTLCKKHITFQAFCSCWFCTFIMLNLLLHTFQNFLAIFIITHLPKTLMLFFWVHPSSYRTQRWHKNILPWYLYRERYWRRKHVKCNCTTIWYIWGPCITTTNYAGNRLCVIAYTLTCLILFFFHHPSI